LLDEEEDEDDHEEHDLAAEEEEKGEGIPEPTVVAEEDGDVDVELVPERRQLKGSRRIRFEIR
jgi:hypothetical protein